MELYKYPKDLPLKTNELVLEYTKICDEFIRSGSANELDISFKTRRTVLDAFKKKEGRVFLCKHYFVIIRRLKTCLVKDLELVTDEVLRSLYKTVYPRYQFTFRSHINLVRYLKSHRSKR